MSTSFRGGALLAAALAGAGFMAGLHYFFGGEYVKHEVAIKTKEPLVIAGDAQHSAAILPVGTTLYHRHSWPEGHSTFMAYFNFKGTFEFERTDPTVISPLWLFSVEKEDIAKLSGSYPLSKDDLISLLKARKVTRDDLADIVRNWQE